MQHFRTLFDVENKHALLRILHRAQILKRARRERRIAPTLAGRVVALLFERTSTRTRISFEAGVALLGGSTVALQARDTQLAVGESTRDSARVIGRYVDVLVARLDNHADLEELARHAGIPVVNGLSTLSHPCQVLTDLFTVYERREDPFDLTWAWVGPAGGIANDLVAAAAIAGFPLKVALDDGELDPGVLARAREGGAQVEICDGPEAAIAGAHVVDTGPRRDRGADITFKLTPRLLSAAADDFFVLHALPASREVEIDEDVIEGRHALVFDQAGNRLCVQQALLEWLLDVPALA